jgi:hypothetical protein
MPELTDAKRDRIDDSKFAYITKDGERKLPIHDESHVRNAIARFNQTDFDQGDSKATAARKILAAARKHGIEVEDDDAVSKAAKR